MGNAESHFNDEEYKANSFPGSAILDSVAAPCGSLQDTIANDASPSNQNNGITKLLNQAEALCVQSPSSDAGNPTSDFDAQYEEFRKDEEDHRNGDDDGNSLKDDSYPRTSNANPTSALFARALVSEVTDNPKTMKPEEMADREKKLLKAQERAKDANKTGDDSKPVGAPGGVGQPSVLGSIAHAITGTTDPLSAAQAHAEEIKASVMPPNSMSENRAQVDSNGSKATIDQAPLGQNTITIGLSLSRRCDQGHPDTVTRQTAFDFNQLQDREYKYVSSTDSSGWRAGGGERGGPQVPKDNDHTTSGTEEGEFGLRVTPLGTGVAGTPTGAAQLQKSACPDTVHIPIIHIDAETPEVVDTIIAALARGEIFIPHMAIMPEALSSDGVSPPDLVVRFGTERNDDLPPDDWPNWCLEFMHNQLYEYFQGVGARWMKRPFSITLAKKVRWKTVKHMNRYFAHAERVIDAWREKGPRYLDPQLTYNEGGATPEEVAKPHGIYLLRNGVPTNYFPPNFDPPYTTKMTRSLLMNVLGKSWDKKCREWTSEPVPRLVTPSMLVTAMCGCGDNTDGFMANEVTLKNKIDTSTIPKDALIRSADPPASGSKRPHGPKTAQPHTPAGTEAADTDIVSEVNGQTTASAETPKQKDSTARQEEGGQPGSTRSASSPAQSQQNGDNPTLDSHISSSSTSAPVSQQSPAVVSPKYGRAPTPEDHTAKPPASAGNKNDVDKKNRFQMEERQGDTDPRDPAASDFVQPSVTGTNSTIMHMNLSAEKFMKQELQRQVGHDEKKEEDPKKLASDDDWLDGAGKIVSSPENKDAKASLEKERARQNALVAMAQEQAVKPVNEVARRSPKDHHSINKNNSGVSLEYSIDSASMLGDNSTLGGSSLVGGKYATDGSVNTAGSKGRAAAQTPRQGAGTTQEATQDAANANEDEISAFSLQESTSSVEVVPSDEELFAVGWAKALDPKSGSYYYFTLDRAQIVWDNPLASNNGGESVDGSQREGVAI